MYKGTNIFFQYFTFRKSSKVENNLRAYYSRELAKEKLSKKSGAGSSEVFKSKWPHFNSLKFLRDVITPRKTQDNLPDNLVSSHFYVHLYTRILPGYLTIGIEIVAIFITNLFCLS